MKTRRITSLLLVLCLMLVYVPLSVFAENEITRTMEIVINEGECVSVWNTAI